MRRIGFFVMVVAIMVSAMAAVTMSACSSDEPDYNNDLPAKIASFVSEYYPNQRVDGFTHNRGKFQVVIDDGPTMVFDKNYEWTSIDGNGSVLPQQLLYDQLPAKVYEYLQQTADLNQVFSIKRDSQTYTVSLLKSTVLYDISSGAISNPQ